MACSGPSLDPVGKSSSDDLIGERDPDRGNVAADVDGAAAFADSGGLIPLRGVLCIFLSEPILWTEVERAKLDARSEGDAVDGTPLSVDDEEDEVRSAPLSRFLALIRASGVLIG